MIYWHLATIQLLTYVFSNWYCWFSTILEIDSWSPLHEQKKKCWSADRSTTRLSLPLIKTRIFHLVAKHRIWFHWSKSNWSWTFHWKESSVYRWTRIDLVERHTLHCWKHPCTPCGHTDGRTTKTNVYDVCVALHTRQWAGAIRFWKNNTEW